MSVLKWNTLGYKYNSLQFAYSYLQEFLYIYNEFLVNQESLSTFTELGTSFEKGSANLSQGYLSSASSML